MDTLYVACVAWGLFVGHVIGEISVLVNPALNRGKPIFETGATLVGACLGLVIANRWSQRAEWNELTDARRSRFLRRCWVGLVEGYIVWVLLQPGLHVPRD